MGYGVALLVYLLLNNSLAASIPNPPTNVGSVPTALETNSPWRNPCSVIFDDTMNQHSPFYGLKDIIFHIVEDSKSLQRDQEIRQPRMADCTTKTFTKPGQWTKLDNGLIAVRMPDVDFARPTS